MAEHQEDIRDPRTTTVLHDKDIEQYISSEEVLNGAQRATNGTWVYSLLTAGSVQDM
jgi:hypothetical protein